MKICHVAYNDKPAGASNGVYRLHQALRAAGQDSTMLVNEAVRGDWTVTGPSSMSATMSAWLRPRLATVIKKGLRAGNAGSPAMIPSSWHKKLNSSDADIVHLHWVNAEMMSIRDISRITKPLVWTVRDLWAFSGTEHFPQTSRWREGYRGNNRPDDESGFDLNKWTWKRKRKHWKKPINIVTASHWMAGLARESALMGEWPITVVPNTIDTDVWKPVDKRQARELLGLPQDERILLFGAMGGGQTPRKGFDLMLQALDHLRGQMDDLRLVVFGELAPKQPLDLGFPIHYTGRLYDDLALRVLYSAADVYVSPAREEPFGNTAIESHACGVPAVVFDNSGLIDTVRHKQTGYLAKAFETEDLAHGIQWVLKEQAESNQLSLNARKRAAEHFSYPVVARRYLDVYQKILNG